MPKCLYPKETTATEEGKILLCLWRRLKKRFEYADVFESYPAFYYWALNVGYELGMVLRRKNNDLPYSPDNCYFEMPKEDSKYYSLEQKVLMNKWNKTANIYRKAAGMTLFDVLDDEELYGEFVEAGDV